MKPTEKHCMVTGFPQRVSLGMFQQSCATENNHGSPPEVRGGARSTRVPSLPDAACPSSPNFESHHFNPFFVRPTSAFFFLSTIDILKFL